MLSYSGLLTWWIALAVVFGTSECSRYGDSSTIREAEESCSAETCRKSRRFLLYDVNSGEGFNLRRDVYMRVAVFVKKLNEIDEKASWTLVLPPWGPLYHWKRQDIKQDALHWSYFFDVNSLNDYVSVIEFDDYLAERKLPVVDHLFYLMNFDFDKIDLQSEWLLEETKCENTAGFPYHRDPEKRFRGWFWGYDGIFAKTVNCYNALGSASSIVPKLLAKTDLTDRAVMIDRLETLLHDRFGDTDYWLARRSMRFSNKLMKLGNEFRKDLLDSLDETDGTVADADWRKVRSAPVAGGPFVCAHLRRQDYLRARPSEVPSMREAALQLRKILLALNLTTVFVATDGTKDEIKDLRSNLPGVDVKTYSPSLETLRVIKEGGAAIVEQWICSHARYFIGSHESTFSFRIQEEREILRFPPKSTFNRFCKMSSTTCCQFYRLKGMKFEGKSPHERTHISLRVL